MMLIRYQSQLMEESGWRDAMKCYSLLFKTVCKWKNFDEAIEILQVIFPVEKGQGIFRVLKTWEVALSLMSPTKIKRSSEWIKLCKLIQLLKEFLAELNHRVKEKNKLGDPLKVSDLILYKCFMILTCHLNQNLMGFFPEVRIGILNNFADQILHALLSPNCEVLADHMLKGSEIVDVEANKKMQKNGAFKKVGN